MQNAVMLTDRQLDVLELLAQWIPRGRIARRLYVSTNTVKTHIANIYTALDVNTRDDAIATAQELGFLPRAAIDTSTQPVRTTSCATCGHSVP